MSLDFGPSKIIAGNSTPVWKATELFIWHFFAIGWTPRNELAIFVIHQLSPEKYVPLYICTNGLTYRRHQVGRGFQKAVFCFVLSCSSVQVLRRNVNGCNSIMNLFVWQLCVISVTLIAR